MKKFNFAELEITDVKGNPLVIADLHEQIGNTLFYDNKNNLAIFELSKKIAKNEPFEISDNEISELLKYVEEWELSLHVKVPFLKYLNTLKDGKLKAVSEIEEIIY